MEARTPRSRRTVWISVSAAVGLIFLYYYSSRSPVDSSPAPAAGSATESGVPSFSGRSAMITPAPAVGSDPPRQAASALKLAVNGVMITPASRAALISVDDRPATLFVEGQQVVDGVVLYALNPDGIVVKRGDELLRLPLRGVQSAGSADAAQSGGSAGVELPAWATESVLLSPPSATEARRTYQNRD